MPPNVPGVHRAIGNPIDRLLDEVWREVSVLDGGEVATYIPELAKADPSVCGLAVATLDGHLYTAGDLVPFTIQSVSKPFVYALALADSGAEAVLAKVGAEPTGDPFNTISLDDATIRAHNPMVNAGAIVTTTLVAGATREEQFARVLDGLSAFAGRPLDGRRGRVRVRARDRRPQPRHRLPHAVGRPPRRGRRGADRQLLPAVLRRRHRPGPGGDDRDPRQRRGQPADGRRGHPPQGRGVRADRHGHVRHVRLLRRVALPRRPARQERGERRRRRGAARPAGARGPQPAPGPAGQQRARRGRLRADLRSARAAPPPARRAGPLGPAPLLPRRHRPVQAPARPGPARGARRRTARPSSSTSWAATRPSPPSSPSCGWCSATTTPAGSSSTCAG